MDGKPFPKLLPGIETIGGKVTDINSMLSMLKRILRDGDTNALNFIERNIVHDALAMVDDDFFKTLQKTLQKTEDFKMLKNNFSTDFDITILEDWGSVRPDAISPKEYVQIYNRIVLEKYII